MAVIRGLGPSFEHSQNGMTRDDMEACSRVADRLDEVIIFRSTGPWAKRWIERGYPTKNFHVKGKSGDWGPQAGFVPYDGTYSKVGYDPAKAKAGTEENIKGLKSQFALKEQLRLTKAELDMQLTRAEGDPSRTAIETLTPHGTEDAFTMVAKRSGDQRRIAFKAVRVWGQDLYAIEVYPDNANLKNLRFEKTLGPLEVMSSGEMGAHRPMTGDYDLLAICPTLAAYGNLAPKDIVKPGVHLAGSKGLQPEARFYAGQGMDNVLDPALHTATAHPALRKGVKNSLAQNPAEPGRSEHPDMGNLTPRILRCINDLNTTMGAVGPKAALRRIHHNAESHRNAMFNALSKKDMNTVKGGEKFGDGFPFTVFQPARAVRARSTMAYTDVCTLETYAEFTTYATHLYEAGYFVPRNWIWGTPKMMAM